MLSTQAFYYTEPGLARLFGGSDDVRVVENGGWECCLTSSRARYSTASGNDCAGTLLRSLAHLIFTGLDLAINRIGFVLEAVDRRFVHGPLRPAMNLLPSTRCPVERGS